MSQFVRDCVRQRDPIVLVDAAAAIRLAHAGYVRHSQGTADALARTNVLPRHQDRDVVMIRVGIVAGIQLLLPLAEVIQRVVRAVRDAELFLGQKRLNLE